MISAQHLCVTFDKVHEYFKGFERNYEEQKLKEKATCDKLISTDEKLNHLCRNIDHLALYRLREELYKEHPIIPKHYSECNCKNRVAYGLLCCHQLDFLKSRRMVNDRQPRRSY